MIRRELLEKLQGYRNEFVYSQDYDLTLRAQELSKIENLSSILYQSRFGGQRISSCKVNEQKACANMARSFAVQRRNGGQDSIEAGTFSGDFMQYTDGQTASAVNNDHVLLYLYLRAGLGQKSRETIRSILTEMAKPSLPLRVKYCLSYLPKPILKGIYHTLDALR